MRRAFVRLAPWVLIVTILGCESRESISRRIARFFLPSRTMVIYFPAASLGSVSQVARSWGNDSLVVSLKEGDRWAPSRAFRDFYFSVLPCDDPDSALIRFDERRVMVVPSDGPWFAEYPASAPALELKVGTGPFCLVAAGYVDAEPRIAIRLRGRDERSDAGRSVALRKVSGNLVWGPTGGSIPRSLWSSARNGPRSGVVMAAWTKRWAAADTNGHFELDSLPQGPVRLVARVGWVASGSVVALESERAVTIPLLREPIVGPSSATLGAWPSWSDAGGPPSGPIRASIPGYYRGSMAVMGNQRFPELRDIEFECEIRQPLGRGDSAHAVFFRPGSHASSPWFEMPLRPEGTTGTWVGFTDHTVPPLRWVLIGFRGMSRAKKITGRVYPSPGGEMVGQVQMQQWGR